MLNCNKQLVTPSLTVDNHYHGLGSGFACSEVYFQTSLTCSPGGVQLIVSRWQVFIFLDFPGFFSSLGLLKTYIRQLATYISNSSFFMLSFFEKKTCAIVNSRCGYQHFLCERQAVVWTCTSKTEVHLVCVDFSHFSNGKMYFHLIMTCFTRAYKKDANKIHCLFY